MFPKKFLSGKPTGRATSRPWRYSSHDSAAEDARGRLEGHSRSGRSAVQGQSRSGSHVHIDATLAAFLESGLVVTLGTRSAALVPELARASAVVVAPGASELAILVGQAASGETLPNLRDNGRMAVTCGCATTFRSVQIKGRCLEVTPAAPADVDRAEQQRRSLARALARGGIPPEFAGRRVPGDLLKIRLETEQLFEQTPGPRAGERL